MEISIGNRATLHCGDSRDVLPTLEPTQFTSCVCDPPYHLKQSRSKGFMGKTWDGGDIAFRPEFWGEVLRVLKPGAMLLAFGGTRTFHRLTCAVEDAGFEIRDCLMWLYGSGFPKSLDISKAFDKAAGAAREVVGSKAGLPGYSLNQSDNPGGNAMSGRIDKSLNHPEKECSITAPATELAKRWDGWGTSLKPAYEPIILAMKPLDGTFAKNAHRHGVAGLNIDDSRIGVGKGGGDAKARWPANLLLDEETAEQLDAQTGILKSGIMKAGQMRRVSKGDGGYNGNMPDTATEHTTFGDSGGASRFFKRCKLTEAESCESVSIAESVLSRPSQAAGFVQSLAAIAGNHADRQLGDSIRRFTDAMQIGSSGGDESNMRTIRNTGKGCLQELRRISMEMLNGNRVNVVETQRLTSITLITQSLLNTLGSVDRVTSRSMCECLALGVKGCESPSSRFLYCAKANKRDRTCDGQVENNHPTVKPRSLMEYLCRLVTPPGGGLILDPFMGSGSTGIGALLTGNRFVGIELEPESFEIACQRIEAAKKMR